MMTIYLLAARLAKYEFMGTSAWFYCLINLIKLPLQLLSWLDKLSSLGFNLLSDYAVPHAPVPTK